MKVRSVFGVVAVIAMVAGGVSAPANADRLPAPGDPGQPLASGQLFGSDAHGVIHCQAAAEFFGDPTLPPGSAPGGIVITPNGPVLGAPRDGICADIYTRIFGGQ